MSDDPTTNDPQQTPLSGDSEPRDLLMKPFLTLFCPTHPRWRALAQNWNRTGQWDFTTNEHTHLSECAACQRLRNRYERVTGTQPVCTSGQNRAECDELLPTQLSLTSSTSSPECIPALPILSDTVTAKSLLPRSPEIRKMNARYLYLGRWESGFAVAGLLIGISLVVVGGWYLLHTHSPLETAQIENLSVEIEPVGKDMGENDHPQVVAFSFCIKSPHTGYPVVLYDQFRAKVSAAPARYLTESDKQLVPIGEPVRLLPQFATGSDYGARFLILVTDQPAAEILSLATEQGLIPAIDPGSPQRTLSEVDSILKAYGIRRLSYKFVFDPVVPLNP